MTNPLKTVLLLALLLGVATYMFSILTGTSKLFAIGGVYIFLILLANSSRNFIVDIGLSKSAMITGIKLAAPFMIAIVIGATIMLLLSPNLFQDSRYQNDFRSLLVTVLIFIPFYTVLLEELAFRGLLLGRLASILTPIQANYISALGFGVWHVFSAQSLKLSIPLSQPLVIVGIILTTSVAGLFFGWLRLHSGSLIAPILVHWCINTTGVIAAFFSMKSS